MNDYTNYHPSREDKIQSSGKQLFYKQFRGCEGFTVSVNGECDRDVIIQQHTNPINERLEDKLMIFLKEDGKYIDWGDEIIGYDPNYKYMVITEPHDNGVYMTCKIRRLPDRIGFEVDGVEYVYECILNNSMLYTESSYVGSSNAFVDEDVRALIIKYDVITSKIKLFDYIMVGSIYYKVSNIDKKALMRQGDESGVLQITLIETIYSDILVNFKDKVRGILRYARLKEAVYNSNARAFLCEVDGAKTGDYITFENDRVHSNIRTHIIVSMVDTKVGYDSSFALNCQGVLKFIAPDKTIHEYPTRFIDNKTMLMESSSGLINLPADVQQCQIKEDEHTKTITNSMRFISNGKAFEVVGVDEQTMRGVLTLRLKTTSFTPDDNKELEIADYYKVFPRDDGSPTEPTNPDVPIDSYTLTLDGSDDALCGFTEDYIVDVKLNGVKVEGKSIEWKISNADGTTTSYATIESVNGYECIVKAGSSKYIGKSVILRASLVTNVTIFAEKVIRIVGF